MNRNVLLVTAPSAPNADLLRKALAAEGYTLQFTHKVEDALHQARQHPPIAIIIDDTAEERLTFCQWLRTDPATVAVTILMTAHDTHQRVAALKAGADEFLTSPLDNVEVCTRLRTLETNRGQQYSLVDFLSSTLDLALGANPVDVLGSADLLSHDLKSPLSVVISNLELLKTKAENRLDKGGPDAEHEQRLCINAIEASRRLHFLIGDMIDLAKIEADAYPFQLESFELPVLVQEVVDHNAGTIARKGIVVAIEARPVLPVVIGDRALVWRVCNVLLDNTLKFTTKGRRAAFTFHPEENHLALRLTDNGQPIDTQYLKSIFERAVQWEARQNSSRTSVGMGLPFARAAIRRMNGDLVAFSGPADKTTVFSLHLPLAKTELH